jgi:hypothetical protein
VHYSASTQGTSSTILQYMYCCTTHSCTLQYLEPFYAAHVASKAIECLILRPSPPVTEATQLRQCNSHWRFSIAKRPHYHHDLLYYRAPGHLTPWAEDHARASLGTQRAHLADLAAYLRFGMMAFRTTGWRRAGSLELEFLSGHCERPGVPGSI